MLTFQPCTPQSCEPLRNADSLLGPRGCDASIINLCSWQHLYNSSIARYKEQFILRFNYEGRRAYSLRFRPDGLSDLLAAVREDAAATNEKLCILGVNEDLLPYYIKAAPNLQASYNEDNSDYVYERQALATLAGHKLQSKRNFLNRFHRNYPNYVYKPLEEKDVDACLALDKSWIDKGLTLGHTNEEINERKTIKYAFDHWHELQAIGGVIYIEGQLVAFTYGAAINNDTFDVCVEKADTTFEGAYAAINNEFVNHLPPQYKWLNREEDLGIPGLRQAKSTYHPAVRLHKYVLTEQ